MDLAVLRVFDATVKMSMRELVVGTVQIAPADIEANLSGGLLSLVLARAQLYGGPVQGRVVMDADRRDPRHGAEVERAAQGLTAPHEAGMSYSARVAASVSGSLARLRRLYWVIPQTSPARTTSAPRP